MSGVHNGPIPTRLALLSDLRTFPPGSKVRFLGCVTNYSTNAATLTLEHDHPQGQSLKALVNVKLLLETIKSHETRVGEWVNVIGYINPEAKSVLSKEKDGVTVQALVLWSTGSLDLQGYERSLERQNLDKIEA
ncbi:hypothetical protein G7Y89_g7353 [Cudoniella acicularis]|uniref:Telomere capping, CST complex subunit-domain-containing protein n=1 Tax=Cudoniella acicularis TaxID=354080 RepID=A0A8H4W219_9HELO|nr:hypothetical protein G7Y89_g7353 [Cudoniella acicularis]